MEILLISENKVRTYSNISTNTQTSYLLPAIREAQLDYELIIGTKLYNKLISLVESGDIQKEENYVYKNLWINPNIIYYTTQCQRYVLLPITILIILV